MDSGRGNDTTFCGYAMEGEACEADWSGQELIETTRGKITCEVCIELIRYAKTVPASRMKKLGYGS